MHDSYSSSDPVLSPLLERLAFLETANDSLKSRLSSGSFSVEMQGLALREQLESSRAEIARLQEALDGFCRENLAAGQARDEAEFIAQGTVKALDAVAQERDALLRRVEALEADLERSRRSALEAEQAFRESEREALEEARSSAEERLRVLAEDSAAREARLAEEAAMARRLRETLEQELERARLAAQETEEALRESRRRSLEEARAEAAERQRALSAESAEREAALLKAAEALRLELEALALKSEQARLAAEEKTRGLLASKEAALAEAEERQRTLAAEFAERKELLVKKAAADQMLFAEREARLLKKLAEGDKLLGEIAERELAAQRAAARERALREMARRPDVPEAPPVEGVLDPVWAKVLPTLRRSVGAAFSRLRQLPLTAIPEGPRAMIRFAAVSLTETSDMLKALEEFFDEAGSPTAPGKAEIPIEAALAAWEVPMRQRRISIVRHVEMGLPTVLLHDESLRVAVFQVLRNAYDAMPRGGKLHVRLSRDAASGGVCAHFSDTGPGFAPRALAALFSPFAAPRPGHLGIGLGLTRRILRRFGGDAEAGNAAPPSRGAVVSLRLVPAAPDAGA
jgi:signal transduction histidine kinase